MPFIVVKSPCIMCVQYRGGNQSTVGDILSTMGDIQYRGDIIFCNLSTVGIIMIHVGGYREYRGGVQCRGTHYENSITDRFLFSWCLTILSFSVGICWFL